MLPDKDWCEKLMQETGTDVQLFSCSVQGSGRGECDYCLNQYAAGKKLSELPQDMVLLFEMDTRPAVGEIRLPIKQCRSFADNGYFTGQEKVYLNQWNQIGGPELADINRHDEGCNILFADRTTKPVRLSELPKLKWDVEGKISYHKPLMSFVWNGEYITSNNIILLIVLVIMWVVCSVYILIQFHAGRYWKFVLSLGIVSAGTGWFFGIWSGQAYLYQRMAGAIPGVVLGFLAGICFAAIFAGRSNELKQSKTFKLLWLLSG